MCVNVWVSEISDGVFCDVTSDLLCSLLYITWTVYCMNAESELYYSHECFGCDAKGMLGFYYKLYAFGIILII